MSTTFQRDRLQAFIQDDDRRLNCTFVGRDDIMDDIMGTVQAMAQQQPDLSKPMPGKGRMWLIQGSPGVGKTSLLDALNQLCHDRLRMNQADNRPYVIPVMITSSNDLSPTRVARRIRATMNAVSQGTAPRRVRSLASRIVTMASRINALQVMGTGVAWEPLDETPDDAVPESPDDCAILLMIDEVQNAPGGRKDLAGQVLTYLEGGSDGMPILPVLAGLANSSRVMKHLGVSRLGGRAAQRLGALTRADVQAALHAFIVEFGIQADRSAVDRWETILWHWSQGWPKHLQNGLSTMGEHLLLKDGDLKLVRVRDAQRDAMRMRHAYYNTRFGPHDPEMIGTIMSDLGRDPVTEREVRDAIARARPMKNWHDHGTPTVDDMLRLGLIDTVPVRGRSRMGCPISSLRSFAVAHTGSDLHVDASDDHIQTLRLANHDVNARDGWNRTPLHRAAQDNWPDAIERLLDHDADPEATDRWGRTPLHVAAGENAHDGMRTLLDHGADILARDADGQTPLHHAAGTGSIQAAQNLLDRHADPEARDDEGLTPLHKAAISNAPECLTRLVAGGASVMTADDEGLTPLHHAIMADQAQIMQVLLSLGADIHARSQKGKTPMDMVQEPDHCYTQLYGSPAPANGPRP